MGAPHSVLEDAARRFYALCDVKDKTLGERYDAAKRELSVAESALRGSIQDAEDLATFLRDEEYGDADDRNEFDCLLKKMRETLAGDYGLDFPPVKAKRKIPRAGGES